MFEMVDDRLINEIRRKINFAIDVYAKHNVKNSERIKDLVLHDFRYIFVVLDSTRARHVGKVEGVYEVLLILQDDPQSVFFDIQCGDFGACWGPDMLTGEFVDLGFRGADPVEIYLM